MEAFPTAAEIRDPLLAFLRDTLGASCYVDPPVPMTPGNDTQVHALRLAGIEQPLVLRVFRKGSDARRPVFEATLQNALAEQGLAVPRARAICSTSDVIGAPFFVMDRAAGAPLYGDAIHTDEDGIPRADWQKLVRQGGDMLFDMPRVFAETCLRIHAIDAKPVVAALKKSGLQWEAATVDGRLATFANCVDAYRLEALRPAVDWLDERRPVARGPDVVCHCDVQPLNLMVQDGAVGSILDWANATIAPPEFELGWTRAMYLTIGLPLPGPLRLLERPIAGYIAGRFTRFYERSRCVDRDAVSYYEAFRSLFGLAVLAEQVVRREPIRDAWNSASAVARTVAHIRERTGLDVSIPWSR